MFERLEEMAETTRPEAQSLGRGKMFGGGELGPWRPLADPGIVARDGHGRQVQVKDRAGLHGAVGAIDLAYGKERCANDRQPSSPYPVPSISSTLVQKSDPGAQLWSYPADLCAYRPALDCAAITRQNSSG